MQQTTSCESVMARISSIVVVVDPAATEHPSIAKAALLASRCQARIELFACETTQSQMQRHALHVASGSTEDFVPGTDLILERLAEPVRKQGMDVRVETDFGEPLHARIVDRALRTGTDLVIKDTHHHSLAQRTFLTNTDWHLIRDCPVPLLLTKSRPWRPTPLVAAAVDPGHVNDKSELLDRRIIDWGQLMVRELHGEMYLLHAWLPLACVTAAAGSAPPMISSFTPGMMEELRANRQKDLESLASSCLVSTWNLHLQLGSPCEVLPRVCREISADIMVMGAIARTGLQRLFLGSTAEQVLEHVPCDVLIVKPRDYAPLFPF